MRYLKKFEGMVDWRKETMAPYYHKKIELTNKYLDKMNPDVDVVSQDINDIFLEWIDDGIVLDKIELCVTDKDSDSISDMDIYTVYYPGDKKKSLYPNEKTNSKICSLIKKNKNLFYNINFGSNILDRAKKIQDVNYTTMVDWDADDIKHLYSIVKECADDMYSRLSDMYSIKLIKSSCYLPKSNTWVKCDAVPEEDCGRVSWVLEINK